MRFVAEIALTVRIPFSIDIPEYESHIRSGPDARAGNERDVLAARADAARRAEELAAELHDELGYAVTKSNVLTVEEE